MSGVGSWITSGLMGLFGLFGLFLVSRAVEAPVAGVGWLIFFASLYVIFSRVKAHYDRIDTYHRYHGGTESH